MILTTRKVKFTYRELLTRVDISLLGTIARTRPIRTGKPGRQRRDTLKNALKALEILEQMKTDQPDKPRRNGAFTVSGQLAMVVAVGISVGFLMVTALQIMRGQDRSLDVELNRNSVTTQIFSHQISGAVRWRKPDIIRDAYQTLFEHPGFPVVAAITIDRNGTPLSSYQQASTLPSNMLSAWQDVEGMTGQDEIASRMEGDHQIVTAPVIAGISGQRVGTLVLVWGLADFEAASGRIMLIEASISILAVGILVASALIFIRRRLSKPLAEITEATDRVANGDKRFEIPWTDRKDEIGEMARALVTFRANVALIDRLTAEQQQQNVRLSTALEREKEYNALHREFVAMVSHEFRTPIAIIDGAAQRMERRIGKDTPERLQERIDKIRAAVSRMVELIDSTLSLSRLEAGTIELELADCNLEALLRDICERQQDIAKDHDIKLVIANLPSSIRIDAKRMDQVFTNLLSNAVKYAPDAQRVEIKAGTVGGNVVVSVRDFGVGIPKDEMPRLFQKFFRASTSTGIPGTGIGLHLVKHLVELHGGTVTVDSVEGQGTTFSVTFPAKAASQPDLPRTTKAQDLASAEAVLA